MTPSSIAYVFGSRSVIDRGLVAHKVRELLLFHPHVATLWSGGARGADSLAAATGRNLGLCVREWLADWPRFGRSAGARRTRELIGKLPAGSPCLCFAPPGARSLADMSPGSAITIQLCRGVGFPVRVVWDDGRSLVLPARRLFPPCGRISHRASAHVDRDGVFGGVA